MLKKRMLKRLTPVKTPPSKERFKSLKKKLKNIPIGKVITAPVAVPLGAAVGLVKAGFVVSSDAAAKTYKKLSRKPSGGGKRRTRRTRRTRKSTRTRRSTRTRKSIRIRKRRTRTRTRNQG